MQQLPVRNPRNGQIDFHIDSYTDAEISKLTTQQREAQKLWESNGLAYRIECLQNWAKEIENIKQELAEALTIDTGRRAISHYIVDSTINNIKRWCEQAPRIIGEKKNTQSQLSETVSYHHHLVPYAVVGIISPWNFPLTLSLIDAIPALLTGSSIILKPSEVTPRFAAPLLKSIKKTEGLSSVFNIVTGAGETGAALIDHVDCVCFTGSVATGRKVGVKAAENFIPAFLELGGKDPAIVMPSADLDNATTAIVRSAIGMTGQACQSLERIYVHESIKDDFLELLISKAKAVPLNSPDINSGQIGPLIFEKQGAIIAQQLSDAVSHGAIIHCGGIIENYGGGTWIHPTVVSNVNHSMQLLREETFGPVVPVISFSSTEEAIALANDSIFGLSGAVFSGDEDEAIAIAEQIQVGGVSVNDASLTAMVQDAEKNSFKNSGIGGSRMGESGMTRFLRKRAILKQSADPLPLAIFSEGQK